MNFLSRMCVLILLSMLNSCKDEVKYTKTELLPTKEVGTPIMSKIISEGCYSDCFIHDSLLILIANCDTNTFHVYNSNTLKLIKKFGFKGEAPHEFQYVTSYNRDKPNTPLGVLNFYDVKLKYNKRVDFNRILKGDNVTNCINATPMKRELLASYSINYLNDNNIAMRNVDVGKGLFMIYNEKTNDEKWVDFIPKLEIEEKLLQSSYYGIVNSNPNKNSIVYSSRYFDEIIFYDLEGNYKSGYFFSVLEKPRKSDRFTGVAKDFPVYMLRTYATEKYLYVLRVKQSLKQMQSCFLTPVEIIALSWEGEIEEVYGTDIFPYLFCINEDNNKLFVINKNDKEENPFSEILVFQLQ